MKLWEAQPLDTNAWYLTGEGIKTMYKYLISSLRFKMYMYTCIVEKWFCNRFKMICLTLDDRYCTVVSLVELVN